MDSINLKAKKPRFILRFIVLQAIDFFPNQRTTSLSLLLLHYHESIFDSRSLKRGSWVALLSCSSGCQVKPKQLC
jgi:hypothetical protein